MAAFRRDEIRKLYQLTANPLERITEMLDEKILRPDDFSIRDTFLATVEDGEEVLRAIDPRRKSGGQRLTEASLNAVRTSDFAGITGQLIFNKVKEGYEYPGLLWPQLVDEWNTTFLEGEVVPGVGEIGAANIQVVSEAEEFPYLGLNEEKITFGPLEKRGFIVAITREILIADNTGLIMQRSNNGGKFLSINKEQRVLNVVTGQVNTYVRNGVASNTYQTSGSYVNSIANPLIDWRALETGELLFDAITDPNTGLPILQQIAKLKILVPSALKRTAERIIRGTQLRVGDGASFSSATYTPVTGGVPGQGAAGISDYGPVLSNAFVKLATSSASQWFTGDFPGAFVYRTAWDIEDVTSGEQSEAAFNRDVVYRVKVSEMGAPGTLEPRKAQQNT
jgi:hypothetical protein